MEYYGITDKGMVRTQNQDCIFIPDDFMYKLYIIADGMGGANAGDVASKNAIFYVKEYIQNNMVCEGDNKIKEMLAEAIKYANEKVYKMSIDNQNYEGMGTTIIAVLIHTIASVILLLKKKKFSLPLLIFTYVMNIAWISILAMVINHATNIF